MVDKGNSVIGSSTNFWLYSEADESFDLTHPSSPTSNPIIPRVPLQTTTSKVWVDPAKTALVVIDMQNFFLSPDLGRSRDGPGAKACNNLLQHAIPACRKAGIRVIWLNWGLTQEEIDVMPPATLRAFGFRGHPVEQSESGEKVEIELPPQGAFGKNPRLYKGLGSDVGPVKLEDGTTIDGGRLLMRDQWNSALYPPLEKARQEGLAGKIKREDVWIHKNRMSGLWGPETDCTKYCDSQGIRTLLFAGVNTDQCVLGSLTDAVTKGYDSLLLSDGSGTTSPSSCQECVEYNSARSWGFSLKCEDLANGVNKMEIA